MKAHSKQWFISKIAETKREISAWPRSMRDARVIASASFPKLGTGTSGERTKQEKNG